MKRNLIVFILMIISHLCWGQTEFWFDIRSSNAETGDLHAEELRQMQTAKLIRINDIGDGSYAVIFYDQQPKRVASACWAFTYASQSSISYIYSSNSQCNLQIISPKKIHDICNNASYVSFEIRSGENSEIQEKVKFTIRKTEQYVTYNGQLVRKSNLDRIKRAEEAERRKIAQRRIELEQMAKKHIMEQEEASKQLFEEKRREEHVNVFLAGREANVYDFSYSAKQQNQATIEDAIKRTLNGSEISFNLQKFNITDDVTVDYNGKTKHNIVISGLKNPDVSNKLTKAIEALDFAPTKVEEPYTKENYAVNTRGNYQFEISMESHKVKVKKRFYETTIEKKELQNIKLPETLTPYGGNYIINNSKLTINNKTVFDHSTVLKYHDTGGASNAFLTLLVPGLGNRRVTYGEKSGFLWGFSTYAFIGAGIGCKLYSNSEYKKYHAATEQSEMDAHYEKANEFNQTFYTCVGIGAMIWLYDIIWVWRKGAQNRRAHKDYKQSHFGFYYHQDLNAKGLTYTINF